MVDETHTYIVWQAGCSEARPISATSPEEAASKGAAESFISKGRNVGTMVVAEGAVPTIGRYTVTVRVTNEGE